MEKTLVLKFMGSPQISLAGAPITQFVSRKAQALFIYIAVTGKLHSREKLAELFWPSMPTSKAMNNLRAILPNLRQLVGSHLLITRQTIAFNRECPYYLDIEAIQGIEQPSRVANLQYLSEAVTQYNGDFLEGFYVSDAPEFENWAFLARERLRELAIAGLHTLANHHQTQKQYAAGLAITHQLLKLDPWRETAHQQQMFFFANTGQRRAALAQYDLCRQMLADEFNVAPMPETIALYEQIRGGLFCDQARVEPEHPSQNQRLSQTVSPHLPAVRCDWGEAVDVTNFYGREAELITLQQQVIQNRDRLILLLGMGGIGKTALVTKLAQTVQSEFEYVIWRSLRNAPPLELLLADLVPFLSDQQDSRADVGRLIHWLRSHRCLVVLDNVETLFQGGHCAGQYRAGYETYSHLFRSLGETQHQSCILLTSREKLAEVAALEGDPSVQGFPVAGSTQVAQALIEARGLLGSFMQKQQLAEQYGGNPGAIKIVAGSIQDVFEGDIEKFLNQDAFLFNGIRRLLEQQFERLSSLEQSVMYWLAINREWSTIAELADDILPTVPRTRLLEAIESLSWRNLIERQQDSYTQQPIVMEYVVDRLVEKIVHEIINQEVSLFNWYSLLKTNVKEYIRDAQRQLILEEISTRLCSTFKTRQFLETQLQGVLQQLRTGLIAPLYGAGNLINLFCHLQIDLTGYDFSRLPLRHAYLQGHHLQSVNFQDSQFHAAAFTQTAKAPYSLAFSPNGKLLANGDGCGHIFVRRVVDDQLLSSWQGHRNNIWTVAWNPDGTIFATCSNDGAIRVWNPLAGECLQTIQTSSIVWTVAWRPDGQRLVSAGTEESLQVWDAIAGHCLKVIATPAHQAKVAVWSLDGQRIISGGDDGTIKVWHSQTGECLQTLSGHTNGLWCLAWQRGHNSSNRETAANRPLLASGSADHTIRLWDLSTGQCLHVLQGHSNAVLRLAWSPDGGVLASSSDDATIRLWDVQTRQCLRILQGHQNSIWALDWNQTEPLLASGSADHTLRLWNPHRGDRLQVLQGYNAAIYSLAWSADNQTLAAGFADHVIRLWNVQTGQCLKKLPGQLNYIWSISWSPDHQTIAACSDNQAIELWNPHTGKCLKTLRGHTNWIWSIVWSRDSRRLISASNDQTIRVWDVNSGQCLQRFDREGWVMALALSPDGRTLASGGVDCRIWLLDVNTGDHLQVLQGHNGWLWSVAWSPNGQMLASGSEDGTVRVWNVQTGECLQVLQTHQSRISSVDWSPDSCWVACGGSDTEVQIWDVATGRCIIKLEQHTSSMWRTVAWQPAGQLLASSSDDDIRIWCVKTGICLHILKADRPYEGMNITGAIGLTDAQKATLKVLGAVEKKPALLSQSGR